MRRINGMIGIGMTALFIIHAAVGVLQLTGLMPGGQRVLSVLAWVMVLLMAVHTIIGIILTADTVRSIKRSGVSYPKENKLFWIRRISGLSVMIFIAVHILCFTGRSDSGVFRLTLFDGIQLTAHILLLLTAAVHVISNIRPLMLGIGARNFRELTFDVLLVVSVILLLSGVGFTVYYIRWLTY